MTGGVDVAEPASAHVCPFGGCVSANVSANVSAYVLAPPPTKALSFWLSSEQPGAEGVADEEGVTDEEGVADETNWGGAVRAFFLRGSSRKLSSLSMASEFQSSSESSDDARPPRTWSPGEARPALRATAGGAGESGGGEGGGGGGGDGGGGEGGEGGGHLH